LHLYKPLSEGDARAIIPDRPLGIASPSRWLITEGTNGDVDTTRHFHRRDLNASTRGRLQYPAQDADDCLTEHDLICQNHRQRFRDAEVDPLPQGQSQTLQDRSNPAEHVLDADGIRGRQ
jgi:hypothetical protein